MPREGTTPHKYSWLGADQLPTELATGIISVGARSYIPQIGRFLQEDPVEGGSANAYSYTYGDPINTADPSGDYTASAEEWLSTALVEQPTKASKRAKPNSPRSKPPHEKKQNAEQHSKPNGRQRQPRAKQDTHNKQPKSSPTANTPASPTDQGTTEL